MGTYRGSGMDIQAMRLSEIGVWMREWRQRARRVGRQAEDASQKPLYANHLALLCATGRPVRQLANRPVSFGNRSATVPPSSC